MEHRPTIKLYCKFICYILWIIFFVYQCSTMWALNYHYYGSNKIPLPIVLWNIWLDWQELCVGTMQMSQSTCYAISDKWRFLCGHYIAVDSVRLDTVLIALSTLLLSTFLCGRHWLPASAGRPFYAASYSDQTLIAVIVWTIATHYSNDSHMNNSHSLQQCQSYEQ